MNDTNRVIKTIDIYCADSDSMSPAPAKIIQEVSLEILLNGKSAANIACAGNYPDELAACFLKSVNILSSRDQILKLEVNNDARRVNVIFNEDKKSTRRISRTSLPAAPAARLILILFCR